MAKKLIDMSEEELGHHIGHLCRGYEELSPTPKEETIEEECEMLILFNRIKRDLVAAVYFARQRGHKKALLISLDYCQSECPEVYAKLCLDDLIFNRSSIKKYNELMRKNDTKSAFEIVDKLREINAIL
jgi:hypothetical protein